ncbi:MAG: hypothetical protein HKN84_08225, partial [Gammaproteobacteria bacterium]|nr:hypothetical protein [Gammaproteobacteria bacterium]
MVKMISATRISVVCAAFALCLAAPASAQLFGSYTVGGDTPDFETIQHAADSLIQAGMSGSVDVLVRPGIYTSPDSSERVLHVPGPIAGSSVLNRLRFAPDAASGADRSNVILQRRGGTLEDGFVVAIASNHTTIESFTIQVTDSTIGAFQIPSAVWMTENLDSEVRSVLVDGFDLRVSKGIRFTQCTDDMSIVGNEVYRAEWGIEFDCRFADRLRVSDNFVAGTGSHANFQQFARDYGIRIAAISAADARVENNVVDLTDSRTYIALSIDSGPRPGFKRLTVSGNRILNWTTGNVPFGAAQAGIWVVGTSVDTRITNNLVSVTAGHQGTTRPYGIYINQYYDNVLIAHNTVYSGGTGSAAFSIVQNPVNPNRLRFLNNIAVTETAFDPALRVEGSTEGIEADYNSYHSESGILVSTPAGTFNTLADWQAQGYDAHSVQKRPEFENDLLDLHLTGSSVGDTDLIGTPLPEVLFDIDGQPRDEALPYMGGDEAVPFPEGQPVARDDNVRVFEETVTRLEVLENDF